MNNMINTLKTGRRWMWLVAGVVAVIAVIVVVGQVSSAPRAVQARTETAKAFTGDLTGSVSGVGRLVAHQDVNLTFQAGGVVKLVNVRLGDKVKAGSALIQLDDADALRSVSQAQNVLDEAGLKVAAAQTTFNSNVDWRPNDRQLAAAEAAADNAAAAVQAAQSDFDKVQYVPWVSSTQQSMVLQQASNNYRQARANLDYLLTNRPDVTPAKINLDLAKLGVFDAQFGLDAAQSTLNKMTLVAPFDGTITAVNVDVGEMPSGPAIRMITADDLEVILNMDEADVRLLAAGQPAAITLDAWPDSQVRGKVIYVSPEALNGQKGAVVNYEVRLSVAKSDLPLRAGLSVEAAITTFDLKNVLLVPNSAIIPDRAAGRYYVNLITPKGTQKTEVTIGARDGENTQIMSGLQPGDEVETGGAVSK